VRLLASIPSDEAREAISLASQSPHPLVRIEALGHLEGVSGSRLRIELRKLLDDVDPEVRMTALRAMEQHNITIAGPFLVLRIQERTFVKLPHDERAQALQTLCKLRPKRGEEVCMTLLKESRLLRPTALEETRALAAQFLAEVASSNDALFLLERIAKSNVFKNSKRVREAAAAAIQRLQARATEAAEAAERRKTERKTQPGTAKKKAKPGATASPTTTSQSGTPASSSAKAAAGTTRKSTANVARPSETSPATAPTRESKTVSRGGT
jgi:hypothetical protein